MDMGIGLNEVATGSILGGGVISAALYLWQRGSKTATGAAVDGSQRGWITELQKRAEVAEAKERDTYELRRIDQARIAAQDLTISMMTEKLDRMDRHLKFVTKHLVIVLRKTDPANPLINVFESSDFSMLVEIPKDLLSPE